MRGGNVGLVFPSASSGYGPLTARSIAELSLLAMSPNTSFTITSISVDSHLARSMCSVRTILSIGTLPVPWQGWHSLALSITGDPSRSG